MGIRKRRAPANEGSGSGSGSGTTSGGEVHDAGEFSPWLAETRRAQRLPTVGADVPCGTCTGCCRASYFVHIRPDEKAALARIPARLLFPAPGLPEGHVLMGYDKQGKCPMLVDDRCSIYAHRPQTCRDFDCRVFAATGIALDAEGPQAGIAERARQWRFELPGARDRAELSAVQAAGAFLLAQRERFPADALPANPAQLAALAIRVYELFAPAPDDRPDDRPDGAPGAPRPSDAELARQVLEVLQEPRAQRADREAPATGDRGAPPATRRAARRT